MFDTDLLDESHASYRRQRLKRRDIAERYMFRLEELFEEHGVLDRAGNIANNIYSLLQMSGGGNKDEISEHFIKLVNLNKERVDFIISL